MSPTTRSDCRRLGSQRRSALSAIASNTGCTSVGEPADDVENLGCGSLLLQRLAQIVGSLAQFVEQPRVLDGNDRLRGEILHQLDLLFAERPHLLSVDDDGADQFIVLKHGHGQLRPPAGELGRRAGNRRLQHVERVNHLLRLVQDVHIRARDCFGAAALAKKIAEGRRQVHHCRRVE